MKLRLDEYYYIINWEWTGIENYMPEDMAKKFEEFCKSHNSDEIDDYLENLYSHIEIIDDTYNINDMDLDKSYIDYTAIIKINDKYYSFDWYYTWYWDFEERVNANQDLVEVIPKEVTITKYEPKQS